MNRIASGETGSTQERLDGVAEINRMLGRWNAELGMVYAPVAESLTWASGNASRTIGTSGNFNTDRPQKILSAQYRDGNNVDQELGLLTFEEYQRIEDKASSAPIPTLIGYNPTFASSLATLYAYPVPSADFTLRLTSIKLLSTVSDGTATVLLPPGYEDAIVWNLMVRLTDYGVVDPYWVN